MRVAFRVLLKRGTERNWGPEEGPKRELPMWFRVETLIKVYGLGPGL